MVKFILAENCSSNLKKVKKNRIFEIKSKDPVKK